MTKFTALFAISAYPPNWEDGTLKLILPTPYPLPRGDLGFFIIAYPLPMGVLIFSPASADSQKWQRKTTIIDYLIVKKLPKISTYYNIIFSYFCQLKCPKTPLNNKILFNISQIKLKAPHLL